MLPDRFLQGPKSEALTNYLQSRYSKYGYRKGKHISYNPEWTPEHSSERYRWVENVSDGLRVVGTADDIVRLDHDGYFTDNFQDETTEGIVYQLPARNGKEQYVPANTDPCNPDCAVVDFHSVTDDKKEAARWADSMAENYAEREREYQAKEDAESRLEEIEQEIKDEYKDFRDIVRELRANCDRVTGISVVHQLAREKWQGTKKLIHKLRAERKRIEEYGIEY